MPEPRKLELSPGEVLSAQAPSGKSVYFEVRGRLGSGGEGVIYEAVTDDGQHAIVKGPLVVGTRDLSLEREARQLAFVAPHPNVVGLLGQLKDPRGHTLMFLERVFENPYRMLNREDVRARVAPAEKDETKKAARAMFSKHRTLAAPISVALELGYELALGLEHLHAKGLVHGDVKPANVLVAIDWREAAIPDRVYFERIVQGRWRGVLIDLGGVRTAKECEALARGLPLVKPPKMTPAYAPPEVLPGLIDAGGQERSRYGFAMDVYAFGLTLYQMLTGQAPYAHLKTPPDDRNLRDLARAKREERDGAHRPVARAALELLDWSDCTLENMATAGDRKAFVEETWQLLARTTDPDPARRVRIAEARTLLGKLLQVEELPLEKAMSLRDAAGDDPRAVRPWAARRVRLDAFASRLALAGRDGSVQQDPRSRKIQRRGDDFWEMQGFAKK